MKWSYTIGTVRGTEVKVHTTFLLFLALLAWQAHRAGGWPAAGANSLFVLAMFFCILLHEFGHILMAARFGVRTPDVLLLPIGGLARLERIPAVPRQEFLIAIAGPLVTLAIVLGLIGVLEVIGHAPALWAFSLTGGDFLAKLAAANGVLLVFNLIPAFPMDGGRVLRSLLAARLGRARATQIASAIGQALAIMGGFLALGSGQWMAVLLALFVYIGAESEARMVETAEAGEGLVVRDLMLTDFRTLPATATLADAAALLLAGEQREFPVVGAQGRVEGLLTRDDLIRGLTATGAHGSVHGAMRQVATVTPDDGFDHAVTLLRAAQAPALPVLADGQLVGLVTMDNVTDALLLRRTGALE
ncbi:MAG: CBS domain-containing protein [Gemmatimonadales bacterium]|nr:CBS domain-containing protein [Gemmatimonadales bacterium]